jgi:membrane protein
MLNPPSQAPTNPVPGLTPEPEGGETQPAPSLLDRLRARVDALIHRVTANRYIAFLLAIVEIANEAGASLFAAALAFGTMFAVIPLVLLLSGVIGWLVDDPVQRQALVDQLVGIFPPLADVFASSLDGAVEQRGALSIVGVIGLLWGASAYYGGLDEVMRRLFSGGGVRNELSRRVRGAVTIVILIALIGGTVSLSGVWALLDQFVGGLSFWRYLAPAIALLVMVLVVLVVYRLVPTAPPSLRAALPPAIAAGLSIGILTNLFSLLAPLLIGGMSGFGVIAAVFGALVWLNFSYQILLFGAAWARVRRDRETQPTGETT